ncbi:stimulated by retinoic acid gene 6 protein-like [Ptychodera flava]|uniref:stimulated by retinoic acid gene 6 protein-like n=1 Tax=Ptychodera flava TaxID=63121 RepID=UPI00396A4235
MVNVIKVLWKGVFQLLLNYGFIVMVYAIFWGIWDFLSSVGSLFVKALEDETLWTADLTKQLSEEIKKWKSDDGSADSDETASDFCSLSFGDMVRYLLAPAALIVILLGFLTKRKNKFPNLFGGRPGLPITVNLLDETSNRLSFVAAFGATTTSVIDLFKGDYYFKIDTTQSWVTVFVGMINVAGIGLVFYPIFACIATKAKVVGSFIGFFYTATWVVFWLWQRISCSITPGNVPSMVAVYYMTYLPIFLFLSILLVRFFITSIKGIKEMSKSRSITDVRDDKMKMNFYQAKYVKHLLTPGEKIDGYDKTKFELSAKYGIIAKVWAWTWEVFTKYIYQPVPGFQYSLRALCTFSVAWQAVYAFACNYIYIGQSAMVKYTQFIDIIRPLMNATNDTDNFEETLMFLTDSVNVGFYISSILSFLMMTMFILRMMASYRSHFMRLCKGDTSFLISRRSAPTSLMVSCLRYAGYQIGYIIWGFLILVAGQLVVTVVIAYQVIYPMKTGNNSEFIKQLDIFWPSMVFAIFLFIVQFFLSKFVFLQEKGAMLAITNRRFFHIMSYFLFFFNVILGLLSCLLRAIKGMVFGTLFLSRIDKSTLMREYENLDRGYVAYLSFLQIEVAHCHPVLVTFCKILLHDQMMGKKRGFEENIVLTDAATSKLLKMSKKDRQFTLVTPLLIQRPKLHRNRWWLAITLHNNPSLSVYRAPKPEAGAGEKEKIEDDDWIDL